jgi:hypothetical protein
MRRHLKAVCQGRPSVQSDVSDTADGRRTRRTWEEGPDALDALGKRDPSPPARGSIELPSIYGQSEEPVLIPRLWRRVQKQLEQLLLSAPLWLLNALTAIGIWLCLSNLDGVELAENVLAFLLFALVLPVALIWAVGRPAANTHAAWASLEGVVEGKQHLEHAVQLLLVSMAMALSLLVTFYTSSSRFSRWLRCQWTWLPEHGLPHGAWQQPPPFPLVAAIKEIDSPSAAVARGACDRIQADLAAWARPELRTQPWDWAGYLVT